MKKSHIITYLIAMVLMVSSYIYFINVYLTISPTLYLHSFHLFGIFLIILPCLFELIFKKDIPLSLIIGFYIFVFMAQIIGSAYHGYNAVPCLDIIAHGYSALLVVLFFAYISQPLLNKVHWTYQIVYLIACGALVGVIWEIIEYCGDLWFGMNNQVTRGSSGPHIGQEAIKDTMIDLISDMIGATIGTITVVLSGKFNKNLHKRAEDEKNI